MGKYDEELGWYRPRKRPMEEIIAEAARIKKKEKKDADELRLLEGPGKVKSKGTATGPGSAGPAASSASSASPASSASGPAASSASPASSASTASTVQSAFLAPNVAQGAVAPGAGAAISAGAK